MPRSNVLKLALALPFVLGCSRGASPKPAPPVIEDGHEVDVDAGQIADASTAPSDAVASPFFAPEADGRPSAMLRRDAPNIRYARLDDAACARELGARAIVWERAAATPGVRAPVRLKGPLHGVAIHSGLAPAKRGSSPYEILDCRLLLAIDDFAAILARHEVVEVIHLSAFRSRKDGGCTPKYLGKQHCAALALDVGLLKKKDGSVLSVEKDFHGKIGLATCAGTARPKPETPAAAELWDIVCESARRALFHVILTPNYNHQHRNHFHLELTPDAEWMLIK